MSCTLWHTALRPVLSPSRASRPSRPRPVRPSVHPSERMIRPRESRTKGRKRRWFRTINSCVSSFLYLNLRSTNYTNCEPPTTIISSFAAERKTSSFIWFSSCKSVFFVSCSLDPASRFPEIDNVIYCSNHANLKMFTKFSRLLLSEMISQTEVVIEPHVSVSNDMTDQISSFFSK